MSTQFFDRQANARKSTAWLVVMFVLCMVSIVVVTTLAVIWASDSLVRIQNPGPPIELLSDITVHRSALIHGLIAGGITAAVICIGSLTKVISLRVGGGHSVAESLGGRRLTPDSRDLGERRLLNIVEEMAIASGTPVPPVFLMDEDSVNAFAAGYSSSDAVIGVTRGATEQLNREELQGVIAHEFSHVLNGDMRMNIRMIGILHGILLISFIGQMILRSVWYTGGGHRSRSDRDKGNGTLVILAAGLVLLVLGSIGSFMGGLLKAAVSRQREYLADASAVQFTRNPGGIASALKTIAANSRGGRLSHPNASEASHMFFAQGVFEGLSGLMATHPPLPKRILAIEPNWDGSLPSRSNVKITSSVTSTKNGDIAAGFADNAVADNDIVRAKQSEVDPAIVDLAADQIGQPIQAHYQYADQLLEHADQELIAHARESYSGRAVMFALLLDTDTTIRRQQLIGLQQHIDNRLLRLVMCLSMHTDALPDQFRLPLVDLTLPALAAMSQPQYQAFVLAFDELVRADKKISLFEWTLARVLRRNLSPHFEPVGRQMVAYYGLGKLGNELTLLFSALAHVGHTDEAEIKNAFDAGCKRLGISMNLISAEGCDLNVLNDALRKLKTTTERIRIQIIDACADVIRADNVVTVREAELLRGIADLLGCPMPPIIDVKHQA